MKGCTDYTQEATRWRDSGQERGRDNEHRRPIRIILLLAAAIFIVLVAFVLWPMLSGEGFSVTTSMATAQTTSAGKASDSRSLAEADKSMSETAGATEASSVNDVLTDDTINAKRLVVYITGAVVAPGVFELEAGARLNDAVELAGGLSEQAARNYVNLASSLQDGMHIHVPTNEEVASGEAARIGAASASDSDTLASSAAGQGGNAKAGQAQAKVNLNTADATQLESLPGIGEATAKKIIDFRAKNGNFKSIEDLKNVSGIGDKKFEEIADKVCV